MYASNEDKGSFGSRGGAAISPKEEHGSDFHHAGKTDSDQAGPRGDVQIQPTEKEKR